MKVKFTWLFQILNQILQNYGLDRIKPYLSIYSTLHPLQSVLDFLSTSQIFIRFSDSRRRIFPAVIYFGVQLFIRLHTFSPSIYRMLLNKGIKYESGKSKRNGFLDFIYPFGYHILLFRHPIKCIVIPSFKCHTQI